MLLDYCLISILLLLSHLLRSRVSLLQRIYLHWDCVDASSNEDAWLQFYADEDERHLWAEENHADPPPSLTPPFPRTLPRRPL